MKKFFYRFTEKDEIVSVAEKFGVPVTLLISLNELKEKPTEGDVLYIEKEDFEGEFSFKKYRVQPFDTLSSVAEKFGVSKEYISETNGVPYLFYGLTLLI